MSVFQMSLSDSHSICDRDANLRRADLSHAKLNRARLYRVLLSGTKLKEPATKPYLHLPRARGGVSDAVIRWVRWPVHERAATSGVRSVMDLSRERRTRCGSN